MSELMMSFDQSVGEVKTALDYISASKSENTRKAYQKDWTAFVSFCESRGVQALPATPEVVGDYISVLAQMGRKVSTIKRHVASISQAHQFAKLDTPTTTTAYVREVIRGVARVHGTAPNSKKAAELKDIKKMVSALGNSIHQVKPYRDQFVETRLGESFKLQLLQV